MPDRLGQAGPGGPWQFPRGRPQRPEGGGSGGDGQPAARFCAHARHGGAGPRTRDLADGGAAALAGDNDRRRDQAEFPAGGLQPVAGPAARWCPRPVPAAAAPTRGRVSSPARNCDRRFLRVVPDRHDQLGTVACDPTGTAIVAAHTVVDLNEVPITAYPDGGFVVELERFQGPLDLLLHLIREQDIDIFDIPIAQITAQFLAALEGVERLGLDRAGEFLEIAALLVRIKVQMLLPRGSDGEGELEDPRAELVRRLLEYEHFREAAGRLEEAERERARRYARGFVPPRVLPAVAELPLDLTWEDVWTAAFRVEQAPRTVEDHYVAQRAVPVEEKIGLILHALARLARVEFRRLVEPYHDRLHGVVTLLAGLELARQRRLALRQSEPFKPLWLYRRQEDELADAPDADH
ncbi:MAG: segregation/condensation protein A [Gemmatimonadetes bacterium]|nr:segregation/condensation protein A [Gemmatimonadota bacterium]